LKWGRRDLEDAIRRELGKALIDFGAKEKAAEAAVLSARRHAAASTLGLPK
jgi:hypothetical protein